MPRKKTEVIVEAVSEYDKNQIIKYSFLYFLIGWLIFFFALALSNHPSDVEAVLYFSIDDIVASLSSWRMWLFIAFWPLTVIPGVFGYYITIPIINDSL